VTNLKLVLNVNNINDAKSAYKVLASTGNSLVKKATGGTLSQEALTAIEGGHAGSWIIGSVSVKLIRDEWPSGKGHELKLVIE
jgi:hypothetical protein